MIKSKRSRSTLIQSIDKDIYQVARKLADQQAQFENSGKRLTATTVYDTIRRSNSSLKRRSKKVLEDSIERVLLVLNEEEDGSESFDSDFDGIEGTEPELMEQNTMNKSITRLWKEPFEVSTMTPVAASLFPQSTKLMTPTSSSSSQQLHHTEHHHLTQSKPNVVKRRRRESKRQIEVDDTTPDCLSLQDLGGVTMVVEELTNAVALPMLFPDMYIRFGIQPHRGVLLHGPPGCGKTEIATAFAAELGVAFLPFSAPSLVAGMSGESEKKIREIFDSAKTQAPCLIFIDEVDAILGKRENAQREMEKRIVAQMLTCLDDMSLQKTNGKPVIIIGATNRPNSIDPALRRAGRFDIEINVGVPDTRTRELILRALTQKMVIEKDVDYPTLAKLTPGFVGADLKHVVTIAGEAGVKRLMATILEQGHDTDMDVDTPLSTNSQAVQNLRTLIAGRGKYPPNMKMVLSNEDFHAAIPRVQPSAKREGFATIPDTTWAHIGALHEVRDQLEMAIVEPIKRPESFARVGITSPTGVLLWGPPGCGKTLLAKAVANDSKANFISIKGPELLNMFVGESERAVRQVFERARSSIPCILFFDELDALVPKRGNSLSEATGRVVNTLLTELDGLSNRAGIYVVAATNRPDMIDPAMLRPGRLGMSIFVDLPTPDDRVEILTALIKKSLPQVTAADIAILRGVARDNRADGFSGADLGNLHRAAAVAALKRERELEATGSSETWGGIQACDWEVGLQTVHPSVAIKDVKKYRQLRSKGI